MLVVQVECPYCHRSLMDKQHLISGDPSIALMGRMEDGTEGLIYLSSKYGDYKIDTALNIPKGAIVQFSCPYCKQQLTSTRTCEVCQAAMVALQFPRGGQVQFCSRRNCKKHLIEFENPEDDLRAFYEDYSHDVK